MDSITQTAKFRLSAIKFAKSQGVTKAAREFGVSRQTIYRWQKRYDGTEESLKPKSRRPHHHPNEHSQEEIDLIKEMREKYPHDGLNMFWYRLSCMNYKRSMSALFRVMRRLSLYRAKPQNPKYVTKPYEPALFPGQKVQIDVKVVPSSCIVGEAKALGQKFYQYTAIDKCTRMRYLGGFEEQLQAYDIIRPYTPRHNGKVERSHRKDNDYFYALNQFDSLEDFRQKLANWNAFSNSLPMPPLAFKSPRQVFSALL